VVVGVQGDHLTIEWRGTFRIDVVAESRDEQPRH
jgi:hypothetical protein